MSEIIKKGFRNYLKLERSLSKNSIEAYLTDIDKLFQFSQCLVPPVLPENLSLKELQQFVHWIADLGMNPRSQARIISGIKTFYKFLVLEEYIKASPAALLESPKIGRKLPDTLSVAEIDQLLSMILCGQPHISMSSSG